MKNLKMMAAGILAVIMLFSLVPAYASSDSPHTEAIEMLRALNIMVGDAGTNEMRENDLIKRSEFAKIAVHTLGLEILTQSYKTKFPDVAADHWAVGYISVAADQGLIIGDTDGNFRPDDTISYREAMTILVRMTGYEVSALAKGGYPTGYIIEGTSAGLASNIQAEDLQSMKRGMVAQMTYNALQVPLMEKTGFSPTPSYTVTDKTLLEDRFDAQIVTGLYSANEYTSLGASTASKGSVTIGGKEYKGLNGKLLGSNVKALIRNNEEGSELLLMLADSARTNALNVSSDEIETLTAGEMKYETSSKSVKLSSPALIYNGKAENISKLAVPENGFVTLYDNDRNGSYDVLKITEYENILVSGISTLTNTVAGKNAEKLVLDPDNTAISFTLTDAEGTPFDFANIRENDIISVSKSLDGSLISAIVIRNAISGQVSEADTDSILVNGTEYGLSCSASPSVGTAYTFYLDINGKIAAFNKQNAADGYGYLNAVNTTEGVNSKLQFALINTNGDKVVLDGADKVRLNGTIADKSAFLPLSKSLVKYDLNAEGQISSIELSTDKSADGLVPDTENFVMNGYIDNGLYKASSGKLGTIKTNENTIIFDISSSNEDKYTKRPAAWLSDGSSYSALVYDLTEDLTASVLVVTDESGVPSADSSIFLVDKTTTTVNEDGETMLKIYGIENGEVISLIAEASDNTVKSLSKGDIIQYRLNSDDVIESVVLLLDADNKQSEFSTELSDSVSVIYGKPVGVFANSVNVTVNNGNAENFIFGDALVYKYDSKTQSGNVIKVSASDIAKYDSASPERLFLFISDDNVSTAVIIK